MRERRNLGERRKREERPEMAAGEGGEISGKERNKRYLRLLHLYPYNHCIFIC